MSSSNDTTILLLNNFTRILDRYFSILILIFGVIGSILNILVLSQRSLRSNPCALFFNMSSIAGLVTILIGIPSRIMAGWSADPSGFITWYCKFRSFMLYVSRTNFLWCTVFATIDRWLSSGSDVRRRRISSLKNARRCIILIFCISICMNLFVIYCYDANQTRMVEKCHGQTKICRLSIDLIYSVIIILLPLSLMVVFGLLIFWTIHQRRNRIQSVLNPQANTRVSRQILIMLFGQVTILFCLTTPHAMQKLYITFDYNATDGSFEAILQKFIYSLVITLTFLSNELPFNIYTLTDGQVFRHALVRLVKSTLELTSTLNSS